MSQSKPPPVPCRPTIRSAGTPPDPPQALNPSAPPPLPFETADTDVVPVELDVSPPSDAPPVEAAPAAAPLRVAPPSPPAGPPRTVRPPSSPKLAPRPALPSSVPKARPERTGQAAAAPFGAKTMDWFAEGADERGVASASAPSHAAPGPALPRVPPSSSSPSPPSSAPAPVTSSRGSPTSRPSYWPISSSLPSSADPHRSKIDADDPRLHLPQARGRTLKKGPAIALVVSLLGAVLVALVIAMQPAKPVAEGPKKAENEPHAPAQPPTLPDTIRNAPITARAQPSALPRLSVIPMPDAGAAPAPTHSVRGQGASPADMERQRAREEALKARAAAILFGAPGQSQSASDPAHPVGPSAPATAPAPVARQTPAQAGAPADSNQNLQARKNSFLDSEGSQSTKDYLAAPLRRPKSPYEVKAGTVVPAVLITAINSDLPGPVVGQVRENVYDTVTGNYLLIPQGTRLLANYDSMVAWGQERVLLCWNRMIFPNGSSLNLDCMPAGDLQGAAGLTNDVDHHWDRIVKGAAIASLLAATTTAVAGNTQGFQPTVPQVFARNAASEVNQVGQQVTRKNIQIQPTITVRPGYAVNVMVTRDMVIAPYRDASLGPTFAYPAVDEPSTPPSP